jgi:hypothetical protein
MRLRSTSLIAAAAAVLVVVATVSFSHAGPAFSFSTGDPDGLIATATRPPSSGKIETETADDFILTQKTTINTASFTGLLVGDVTTTNIPRVSVDMYRVFPNESDQTRTITVPTRTNSPGDVELDGRDTVDNNMSFTATVVNPTFNAANSVLNGIQAAPNQTTGGEGPVSGQEVRIDVTFTTPFDLAADHYFFRPEVEVTGGEFFWLSAAKPIVAPGTPFDGDLQTWTRNETLAPDWVRVGTDVVGAPAGGTAPTFNASFSLSGEVDENPPPPPTGIPLPTAAAPGFALLAGLGVFKLRKSHA